MSEKVRPRHQRRVVVALPPADAPLVEAVAATGYRVVHALPEALDAAAQSEGAIAVVADADLAGVLAAVARLRKSQGPAAAVPVLLLGGVGGGGSAPTHHPAVQVGADAFFARPVQPDEITRQFEALVDTAAALSVTTRLSPRRASALTPTSLRPAYLPAAPNARPTPVPRSYSGLAPAAVAPSVHPSVSPASIPPTVTTVGDSTRPSAAVTAWLSVARPPEAPSVEVGTAVEAALRGALDQSAAADLPPEPDFELPPLGDDALDDLVPPELLEPLDGSFDDFSMELSAETTSSGAAGVGTTNPGLAARRTPRGVGTTAGAGLVPLLLDGEPRLAGAVGRFGVGRLFAAGSLGRSTGVLALRTPKGEWRVSLDGGHVLSARSDRAEDQIGPLLARLGYIPREAARFANAPLDAGARGAALLAARGYIAPDALGATLGRAAEEMVFDLVCLPSADWELRPLESSVSIPMPHRALDALLLHACRARLEPATAYAALGGDGTVLTARADGSALAALGLSPVERAAASSAKNAELATLMRTHGEGALPAMVALYWLHMIRAEGPAHDLDGTALPPGVERTRLRALIEAANRKDYLVLLGVSAWATRNAASAALASRRTELDAVRARVSAGEGLQSVYTALDEASQLMADAEGWERYTTALRSS